jgi:hypothetical protein
MSPSVPASSGRSPAPPPDDWVALFDGTRAAGLHGFGETGFPAGSWVVADGQLRTVPGRAVDLVTDEVFGDFELEFTWRVTAGGNGGVIYRVDEGVQAAWMSGPEYQLLDDAGHPDGGNPRTSAAALYDLIEPGPGKVLAPVGDTNRSRIVVLDGRVEHWLNDAPVVAYDWRSPDVLTRIAASKFSDLPSFMANDVGRIVFQHHGEEVAFGAIRVRRR